MCGITGVVEFKGAADPAVVMTMRDEMEHRGPDDAGLFVDGPVGLGHRRLSIIDLTAEGHQPMVSRDQRYVLVYNGEIYNYIELMDELKGKGYRFHSTSDTEVLLNAYDAWGKDCVLRFNGMFAFALWDQQEQSLFCARDRLGVKPFYYVLDEHRFAFASEIKALLRYPGVVARANRASLRDYVLTSQLALPGDETFFVGVKKLLPGHRLTVSRAGKLHIESYWSPKPLPVEWTEEEAVDRLRSLLQDAVRLRLRSDVPVGFHLSGGLDSSGLVSIASGLGLPAAPHTFSGAFAEGGEYDERRYIRVVVDALGTNHHEFTPGAAEFATLMGRIVWHMDEPAAGPGVFPQFLLNQLISRHVKVAIGGQGGDELFGGYIRRYAIPYLRALPRQLLAGRTSAQGLWETALNLKYQVLDAGGATMVLRKLQRRQRHRQEGGRLFTSEFEAASADALGQPQNDAATLEGMMNWDLVNYLPALLQVEDRTSMAFSVESRTPLLDYRLVEFALSLPTELKLRHLTNKYVLRRALRGTVPDVIVNRRDKRGFPTPVEVWFRTSLNGWLRDQLLGSRAIGSVFDGDAVERLVKEHRATGSNAGLLWRVLYIATWFDVFGGAL